MKLSALIKELCALLEPLGPDAEVVIYDTDSGEFVRDVSAREIEAVEATEAILRLPSGGGMALAGEIIKLGDVTRPLVEGKSKPIRVVELMI